MPTVLFVLFFFLLLVLYLCTLSPVDTYETPQNTWIQDVSDVKVMRSSRVLQRRRRDLSSSQSDCHHSSVDSLVGDGIRDVIGAVVSHYAQLRDTSGNVNATAAMNSTAVCASGSYASNVVLCFVVCVCVCVYVCVCVCVCVWDTWALSFSHTQC